jgi:hypothetical protein
MEKIGKSLNGYGANKTVILALRKNIPMNDTITEIVKKWCETSNSNIFYADWDTDLIIVPCFLMIIDRAFGGDPVESSNTSNYKTWMSYVQYCQVANSKDVDFFSKDYSPVLIADNFIPNNIDEIAEQLIKPKSYIKILNTFEELENILVRYLNEFKQLRSELLDQNPENADYRASLYHDNNDLSLTNNIYFNNCEELKNLLIKQNINIINFRYFVLGNELKNYKPAIKVDDINNDLMNWLITPEMKVSKFLSH